MERQKQIVNAISGAIYYEINFTVVSDRMISTEQYEEINEYIDTKIHDPEAIEAQTACDALTGMMAAWRIMREATSSQEWKDGFIMAWIAAGGAAENLINTK